MDNYWNQNIKPESAEEPAQQKTNGGPPLFPDNPADNTVFSTQATTPYDAPAPAPQPEPVYSAEYNTDRLPYYGSSYQTPKQEKQRKPRGNTRLAVLCVVLALVFSFVGTALANALLPGGSGGSGGAPVIQTVAPDGTQAEPEPNSYSAVVEKTQKSVVEIKTETQSNTMFGESTRQGAGSGVIISEDGYILTNNHVISGSNNIQVVLPDGTVYDAEVIGTDALTDIAVLKINASGLSPATLGDSAALSVGDRVIAIGNPLGSLGGTVTEGIISATDRDIVVSGTSMTLLQTSAAVNPGNSGGGLFNMQGELVGIVNAKSGGTDVEGLGFAVPINTVKEIIDDLMTTGYVTGRPEIGVSILNITDAATASQYGVSRYGVYIMALVEGGPAERAGLQVGDYLVSINGIAINTINDFTAVIDASAPGDTVSLQIIRDGRTYDYDVVLREKQS